jgi:hypothetical protein
LRRWSPWTSEKTEFKKNTNMQIKRCEISIDRVTKTVRITEPASASSIIVPFVEYACQIQAKNGNDSMVATGHVRNRRKYLFEIFQNFLQVQIRRQTGDCCETLAAVSLLNANVCNTKSGMRACTRDDNRKTQRATYGRSCRPWTRLPHHQMRLVVIQNKDTREREIAIQHVRETSTKLIENDLGLVHDWGFGST